MLRKYNLVKPPIQAFATILVLCLLICLLTYTSDINTDSFKETFECYHFYTFVYMPSQSVFYYIEICVLPKNKTQTTNFQKSVKNEPVCAFPPQSVQSV